MNIDKREREYKHYLQVTKIKNELWDKIRNIPFVKMDKPEQDGWFVDIELIPEVLRRDDSNRLSAVLDLFVKPYILYKNQGHIVNGIRKYRTFNKCRHLFMKQIDKSLYYHGPSVGSLSEKEFKSVPEVLHKYIYRNETTHVNRWGGATHTVVRYHLDLPDYMFQLKVRKRMMTMIRNIDPELESEYAFYSDLYHKMGVLYWRKGERDYKDHRNPSVQRPKVRDKIRHYLNGDIDDDKI